jgi:hypothetical protein
MTAPSTTTTFDSFFTSTITNYLPGLTKNFIEDRPILKELFDNYKHMDTGSYAVQGAVEYGQNINVKMFEAYDGMDTTPSETALPYIYSWRQLGGAATISEVEWISNNSSKEKIFDLFESRLRQLTRSLRNLLGTLTYGDGTSYNNRAITGLAAAISTTPSTNPTAGAVGGLDATAYTWWRNNATTSCGSFANYGVNGAVSDYIESAWNNCTDGATQPHFLISDQTVYEYYNATQLKLIHYNDPNHEERGDLSFSRLMYKGRPWYWDRQCPAARLYMINRDFIQFWCDSQMFFKWSSDRTWPNQLVHIRLLTLRLALITKARMFSAVLDGWSA